MRQYLLDVITFKNIIYTCDSDNIKACEIEAKFKAFIAWLHDPKCPFNISFNGLDKTRPRIEYEKGNKTFNIDEVWEYWIENVK